MPVNSSIVVVDRSVRRHSRSATIHHDDWMYRAERSDDRIKNLSNLESVCRAIEPRTRLAISRTE
ncbi:hypothetical protein ACVIHI_006372 [Bradyrhizobium sp. USDA 4524]|nr:hypothetical protein [Bradyrhizobium sp. USDA 4538]MCP1901273.1 hypothetical protein [Bradyrhizobium sp. USDA 4537]MCP1993071.1 hypothetical protein [Bradyrhizobium sp. USDA 4539]